MSFPVYSSFPSPCNPSINSVLLSNGSQQAPLQYGNRKNERRKMNTKNVKIFVPFGTLGIKMWVIWESCYLDSLPIDTNKK